MVQITIPNVTYLRQRWALNLVLPGIMETLAIVAPWKGFAYHEATWRDLTSAMDSTIKKKKWRDFDNDWGLDYLLTNQGGVCMIINNTYCMNNNVSGCCMNNNVSGEVEINVREIYK